MARPRVGPRRLSFSARPVATAQVTATRSAMFRDVVMLLYATTGRLQKLKKLVASALDLNSAEYSIVAALYRLGPNSGTRVRDIADYLHMAPENVTTAVGQLVKARWVVKAIDPTDARAVTLKLHRTARQRIDRLTEELIEVNDIWFRNLEPAEISRMSGYLEHVLDSFEPAYQKASERFRPAPTHGRNLP
jgi:DNA-binding MarR family transcriptional regulator